jgi:hypothetical protein
MKSDARRAVRAGRRRGAGGHPVEAADGEPAPGVRTLAFEA